MIDCVDYVITHKEYPIEQDDLYCALCVGDFRQDGWLSEQDGVNIAEYNDRINECTGLYWIWKNTKSRYVGMSHYRRWFYNNRFQGDDSRLDADRINEILCKEKYDLILTGQQWFNWRVIDNFNLAIGPNLTTRAYDSFLQAIKNNQPEYVEAFKEVMIDRKMYICNLFVTRREIMDEYCAWLFSFLLKATDGIYLDECSDRQKRVAGYYAEALWTVWLQRQPYRVYELPHRMVWG